MRQPNDQPSHAEAPGKANDARGVTAPGRFGRAVDTAFAGIEVPWHEAFTGFPLTVEVWAKVDDFSAGNVLVGFAPPVLEVPWRLYVSGRGQLAAEFTGRSPRFVRSSEPMTAGQWHHLAMQVDAAQARLFIDGQLVGEAELAGKPPAVERGPLVIGTCAHPGSGQLCHAWIEAVRVSSALRDFEPGHPPRPEADGQAIGVWQVGEQSKPGQTVPDLTGQGLDGCLRTLRPGQSLDELDAEAFAAGPDPFAIAAQRGSLSPGPLPPVAGPPTLSLDGAWQLVQGGDADERLAGDWSDAVPAAVPGSIHTALKNAGIIPDPTHGMEDAVAREMSFKTWWLRKTFPRPAGSGHRLVFDGVAIRCTVWLNGHRLGDHEGMFGGPTFDIAPLLRDQNDLVVRIDPAPQGRDWFWDSNDGWRKTVVFNNVYGWHYANIPALGIWQPVRVVAAAPVRLEQPFVRTVDPRTGEIEVRVDMQGPASGWAGRLTGVIEPDNFAGEPYHFAIDVNASEPRHALRLQLTIPDARAWWPNGMGAANLYRLRLAIQRTGDRLAEARETTFGLRTIEMQPQPDGPHPKRYNWIFVVNGQPMFVKGTGWCTLDALMDFRRERYERFLRMAQQEHCQMLRAWGGGMPETDDFYDLCDRLGLMVMQEWPTAWNSHAVQPQHLLEETVRQNTLRLRNHPSLVMWGAGNESSAPHGPAIDMMGRLSVELDGTRPFHRGEAWGGSEHNYDCWWGQQPLDHNLKMTARFWGEFGIASLPNHASVQRYLPDAEKHRWPPITGGSFAHHTPVFNRAGEMARLKQYSGYFTKGQTMERFIDGSQLAQAVGVRHTLERARTRWPDCAGALLYKLNDNFPAASWSTVDWYGAPKPAHWFVQDAFAPLHACVLLDRVSNEGRAVSWPIFLLDDADALANAAWQVVVRAYEGNLQSIAERRIAGAGSIDRVRKIGDLSLAAGQTQTAPLLVTVSVERDGVRVDDTFYFVNYESRPDCLFELPRTTLSLRTDDGQAVITNTGNVPAVGVTLIHATQPEAFETSNNYVWLEPGEQREVTVNRSDKLAVRAWNADATS